MGLCKAIFALDDTARENNAQRVLDTAFLQEHTHGFDEFEASVRACEWKDIERESGLWRIDLESAAAVYC